MERIVILVSPVTNDGRLYYTFWAASFLALLSLVHGPLPAGYEENITTRPRCEACNNLHDMQLLYSVVT